MHDIKANWKNKFKVLFYKKSIEELNERAFKYNRLKKSLTFLQIVFLGIGVIIGAGIFVLTGVASCMYAGPAITLSYALSGLVCICAGLCYAEFASILNTSGSSYSYTYITFGEFPAWIVGSMSIIGYFLGAVSVAAGWSGYFTSLLGDLGIYFSEKISHPSGYKFFLNKTVYYSLFDLPAFLISLLLAIVLCRGIILSSLIISLTVIIKLLVLTSFILIGLFSIDIDNWIPYIPPNTGVFGEYGFSGIITGTSMVFLAFNGFDSICTAAQEVKNPRKNIPLGIITTILFVTIIYIFTAGVMTGLVDYGELCVPQALAVAVKKISMPWFNYFIKFGALAGLSSVILVSQYTVIRMLLIMAEDKLLPKFFTKVHFKLKIPHIITMSIGVLMAIIAATTNLEYIVKLSSFFILLTLIVICFSIIAMRYKKPYLKRGFKCPFVPFTPIVTILLAIYILYSYPIQIYFQASIMLLTLILFYFIYKMYHQKYCVDT